MSKMQRLTFALGAIFFWVVTSLHLAVVDGYAQPVFDPVFVNNGEIYEFDRQAGSFNLLYSMPLQYTTAECSLVSNTPGEITFISRDVAFSGTGPYPSNFKLVTVQRQTGVVRSLDVTALFGGSRYTKIDYFTSLGSGNAVFAAIQHDDVTRIVTLLLVDPQTGTVIPVQSFNLSSTAGYISPFGIDFSRGVMYVSISNWNTGMNEVWSLTTGTGAMVHEFSYPNLPWNGGYRLHTSSHHSGVIVGTYVPDLSPGFIFAYYPPFGFAAMLAPLTAPNFLYSAAVAPDGKYYSLVGRPTPTPPFVQYELLETDLGQQQTVTLWTGSALPPPGSGYFMMNQRGLLGTW